MAAKCKKDSRRLSINDVMVKYGVSRTTIYRWFQLGYITKLQLPSRTVRFDEETLERELEVRMGRGIIA